MIPTFVHPGGPWWISAWRQMWHLAALDLRAAAMAAEWASYPTESHDDRVDALVYAYRGVWHKRTTSPELAATGYLHGDDARPVATGGNLRAVAITIEMGLAPDGEP